MITIITNIVYFNDTDVDFDRIVYNSIIIETIGSDNDNDNANDKTPIATNIIIKTSNRTII